MTAGDERAARPADLERASRAVVEFLAALGYDTSVDRLAGTPERVAAALAQLLRPEPLPPTTLMPAETGGAVIVRDLPFQSLCEHHLLPFRGVAHLGYLPGEGIVGLSTLARIVTVEASDLQIQERLTEAIADRLQAELAPRGVGVILEAEHLCMSLRGFGLPTSRVVTSAFRGALTTLEPGADTGSGTASGTTGRSG
ncbi:MAG: GTP cyclohydrolase I FolE [Micrococcales bacterium]|nr:GTP cyclohydrolase I FolE [Micrococcales bacterium]